MEQDLTVSKTRRKQEMHALQALGETLVALPKDQFVLLDLPESLRDAIVQARTISQRGALRRQLQYVGRLMRDVDADHIRRQLESVQAGTVRDVAILHHAERWRERFLADEDSLAEFVTAFPSTDVQKLRTQLRNAKREIAAQRPPRHFRQLLRDIRQTLLDNELRNGTDASN
ncbi:MAG: ribosome biogenesis factor YjgA [Burkholderiales bacterium]|jgi:ribosome-associated protein